MNDEKKIILAFVFKKSGKKELAESELYLTLSMDLQWFKPEEAKNFVKKCIKENILEKQNDLVKPPFDIEKVKIPVGFKPDMRKIKEDVEPREDLILSIAKASKKNEREVKEIIKKIQVSKKINFDVACLILAKEYGIEINSFIKDIKKI